MRADFIRQHRGPLWLGLLGLLAFVALYRWTYPIGVLPYSIDRKEVYRIAGDFLAANGYNLQGFKHRIVNAGNEDKLRYLEQTLGVAETRQRLRTHEIPLESWRVEWYQEIARGLPQEAFTVGLSSDGKIVRMEHTIPPNSAAASLDATAAKALATEFLKNNEKIDLASYTLERHRTEQRSLRTDHNFVWSRKEPRLPDAEFTLSVEIKGDKVGRYGNEFEMPPSARQRSQRESGLATIFYSVGHVGLLFFILLSSVVIFIKRYHAGEVGVKTARYFFAVLLALSTVVYITTVSRKVEGNWPGLTPLQAILLMSFFVMAFTFLPMALSAFLGWSVGEAEVREHWPARTLAALDGFLNRKWFTLNAAESIFVGYLAGFFFLGATTVVSLLCTKLGGGWAHLDMSFHRLIVVGLIVNPVFSALYAGIAYRLFLITWLRRAAKRLWLAVTLAALVGAIQDYSTLSYPLYLKGLISFAGGLFLNYLFVRYGLLASMMAEFTYLISIGSAPFLFAENANFRLQGLAGLAFGLLPAIVGLIGLRRQEVFHFKGSELPEHVRRISERARMTRELEIARQVQMDLLPHENPKVLGYDISGICIPATEVGGDYYDFISLGENRLGIAIGDVSGKGVPAAIYMTLTKGILQSHAEGNIQPREVLIKVNSLMFRTIKRGNFVSMIYAVLDLQGKTLHYARAGHNPVMLLNRDGKCSTFLPQGMALGLDRGELFAESLELATIDLNSGDLVIFYTDGFTEAMNGNLEELGEERWQRLIENVQKLDSSKRVIDALYREVKKFTGDHPQNDDMTMVVVRVT